MKKSASQIADEVLTKVAKIEDPYTSSRKLDTKDPWASTPKNKKRKLDTKDPWNELDQSDPWSKSK